MGTDLPHPAFDCEKSQAPLPGGYANPSQRDVELRKEYRDAVECGRPMNSTEILHELFSYHPPTSDTLPKFQAINQAAKNFAEVVLQNCPSSADRSAAIRLIRDARMTANASVALNGLSL